MKRLKLNQMENLQGGKASERACFIGGELAAVAFVSGFLVPAVFFYSNGNYCRSSLFGVF
ncbi:hypothetical protein CCAN11_2390010 [Capnocytophaga canimorsus]|uniref:Uncharacterized protein n=1 Tax=Capnocytophaga canimorsus TaxID=28188 RepID=A0A0B7IN66_9FLAO|nr:hypothetical protein CCAN11_2390010 [Capnocytophaga canimorsus]